MQLSSSDTRLVLPLSEPETLEVINSKDIRGWAEGAETAKLATAFLILSIPSMPRGANLLVRAERGLAELIGSTRTASGRRQLNEAFIEKWSADVFSEGLRLLTYCGINLIKATDRDSKEYLCSDGSWNFAFSEQTTALYDPISTNVHSRRGQQLALTDPQARSFLQVLSEPDESTNIQGFAGSGKTHLVDAIVSSFESQRTLILAFTRPQLNALLSRLSARKYSAMTFSELANKVLAEDITVKIPEARLRSDSRFQVSDEEIASMLNIASIASLSPRYVANIARKAVMSFCNSADQNLKEKHLPPLPEGLSTPDTQLLVGIATMLWREVVSPSSHEIALPLRAYHKIKYWSLSRAPIPVRFTQVIIDEAHEISDALMAVLDRSPQAVITLGDKFQRLDGVAPRRSSRIREKEINLTVRAGRQIEDVLNPLIMKHPGKAVSLLEGTPQKRTHIQYYDRPVIPSHPVTILVDTEWALFEWFQRLSYEQAKFAILPGSLYSFRGLIEGCLKLFKDGRRSNHPFLFRYATWEALSSAQAGNSAFQRISRMLEKGYSWEDFENNFSVLLEPEKAPIILGKVEHAKNMEFDSVMLAPDLFVSMGKSASSRALANKMAQIYTGSSRTRFELIVPGFFKDWLSDQ